DDVCSIANYAAVEIFSTYFNDTKIDILTDGIKMGLVYSHTWTCYNGREKACGQCAACQLRLEPFSLNNITDPIEYE
ncbi:7-cyano-7-deazaguanine synthase, partial [Pseudoalteromonas sp. S1727]|uniref:7-cyano-7-deazaguanine synthase n=1 Tax=Pseudoalteromonas sp. S1727 TaxID=2066514 RepID=UPI001281F391